MGFWRVLLLAGLAAAAALGPKRLASWRPRAPFLPRPRSPSWRKL